jgi:hypothetical protein
MFKRFDVVQHGVETLESEYKFDASTMPFGLCYV